MKTKYAFALACLIVFCVTGYLVINHMKSNRAHCSFVEGTVVLTKQGLRAIEQIVRGDEVYAYDIKSGRWSYKPVIETVSHEYSGNLVTIKTENETIRVTADHPFLVVNNQRSDYRPYIKTKNGKYWVSAEHLKAGDALLLRDNTQSIVRSVRIDSDNVRVYSLNVKNVTIIQLVKRELW